MAGKITGADLLKGYYNSRGNSSEGKDDEDKKKVVTGADLLDGANKISQYRTTDTSSVNDEYINTFISDANNFFKGAEDTYKSIGWGNASSVYDSTNSTWQDLKKRKDTISAWLYQNKSRLTEDSYKSISDVLNSIDSNATSLLEGVGSAKDFYGQWETEDSYNQWKAKEDEKQALLNSEDFKANSGYVSTKLERGWDRLWSQYGLGYEDLAYEYINDVDGMRSEIKSKASAYGADTKDSESSYEEKAYDYINDEEKAIYNYYYTTQGKDKAQEYLNSIEDTLQRRKAGTYVENIGDSIFLKVAFNSVVGLDQWESGVENLGNFILGTEGNPTSAVQYAGAAIREDIESDFWRGAWDLGVTISNQLPSILVGTVTGSVGGLATMGASVLGNSYAEMRNLGYDENQSRKYAILVTAAEVGLQALLGGYKKLGGKLSNGATEYFASMVDNGIAKFAIRTGGSMLSEGVEEALQSILEPAFKSYVTGEAYNVDWSEVIYSGLLGALSAGVLEGVPSGVATLYSNNKASQIYGDSAQELVTESLDVLPEGNRAVLMADKYKQKLESGKKLTGQQLRNLVEANDQALYEGDIAKITDATKGRLAQLGETGDTAKIADIIAKQASGEKLTLAEKNALKNSVYGQRVANEISPENIQTGGYASEWAKNIGTERINSDEYNLGEGYTKAVDIFSNKLIDEILDDDDEEKVKNNTYEMGTTFAGEEVSIEGITSIKNGDVYVRLNNGEEVNVRDVEFRNDNEALIYEAVADMDTDTARDLIEGFNQGNIGGGKSISLGSYLRGFNEAYRYGSVGIPVAEMSRKGFSAELSVEQRQIAYNRGRADAMTNVKADQAKVDGAKNAQTTTKSGKVTYLDGAKPSGARQKSAVKAIEVLSEAIGNNWYVFSSYVENGERVYRDVDGQVKPAPNGKYDTATGDIYIDLNAGNNGEGLMVFTMAHELTHFIHQWSPVKFKAFADFLLEQYGEKGVPVEALIQRKIANAKAKNRDLSYAEAYEEVIADSCESMLRDSNAIEAIAKLKAKDPTVWEKIKNFISKLVAKIKAAYAKLNPDSIEGRMVLEMKETAEKLQAMWTEALVDAGEAYRAIDKSLFNNGIMVDTNTESASLFAVRDLLTDKQQQQVAKTLAERFDVTVEEAKSWIKAETSLASLILNPKYSQYLDYTADPNEVAIKQNADYPQGTVDFSPICAKRREFTSVMNNILRLFPNHVFAATDLAKIRTIMQEEGMTIPCGICYVEDRRQLDTIVAQNFIDSLKLYREGSRTRPDGKPFNANQLKGLKLIDGDSYTPSVYELVSLEGLNILKEKNPNMAEAWVKFNNARGMQAVRLLANEAEYKRQILKYSKSTVKSKNDKGGLRVYSFSDAEMFHLIDIIQVITDSATVGLSLQGYTKVNEYARAVKDTGEKLNRSLIPKGELGYHMENGQVVLDYDTVEGIDINHPDFFDNRDNPNVGNITIGINDVQIRAAMVSDFVDQIIPFHTGQSEEVLGEKGIDTWDNYKDFQTEKDIATGKVSDHQINIYTEVLQVLEKEGKPITKRTFVEKFLQVCKENNLTPRFSQFLNTNAKGEYIYTEGYHKMLVDFKTFAQTEVGEYLPQKPVKPIFDDKYITKILKDYVKSQKVKDAELAKSMPKVIERITNEIVKPNSMKHSDRDVAPITDADYAQAEKHFGTTRNYEVAGYLLKNGKMLDFSGKHWGGDDFGYRQVDHRDIQEVLDGRGNNGVNAMIDMISNGNIRLMPETGGINLAVMPNESQLNQLRGYINHFRGEVIIDVDAVGGDTIHSWEYNRGTSSARILSDIKAYFENGTIPQPQSSLNQFRYSDRVLMGSLFSGGGTLEAGLVYQMLDKEFAVEYNKQIASVYTDNHGKEHMFVGDVQNFNSKEKQNVFYLHASPVCKNFSPASHSGGETTLDITTAQATARVLEEQMPQVFTVENVKRYIGSEAYNIITNKLNELGYTWDVDVYKASDYGNATKRERMIIRAVKSGNLPNKPQKASKITSWGEATRDLWKTDLIPSTLVKSKIEAIKNTPELKNIRLTKLDKPLMIYDTTKSKKITYAWADELAPTLTTKCGDARIIMPDGRVYAPTPKFMGRIQGLPDNYKYPKATTNAFKIIGNGIPTQLTKAVMGGVLDSAYEQTHDGKVLYSDRDSEGNQLSKEQQEFFKDSKVRDKDGRLLVCTHNSPSKFTVFDKNMIGDGNGLNFGAGFYFFARSGGSIAKHYGDNQYKSYLNLKNPYDYYSMSKEYIVGMLEKSGYDYDKEFVDSYDYEDLLYADLIDDFLDEALKGKDPYTEFSKMLQNAGFDGIWADEEIVAFEPNQIKSVTNEKPTSDPDIRYSDRDLAPTFYSQMGKVVDGMKQDKFGADSIIPMLRGRGVKSEEIRWSGIATWLEGKKSVTKAELMEFIQGSQLQIGEQMTADEKNAEIDLVPREGGNKLALYIDGQLEDTFTRGQYDMWVSEEFGDVFLNEQDILDQVKRDYARNVANTNWSQYKLGGGTNYREIVFTMPNSTYTNRAMKGHWGQDAEGVLAHARIQDFVVNGKKMLFIEEIQSDWHNEGHSKGYSTKEYEDAVESHDKLYNEYKKMDLALHKYIRSNEFMIDPEDVRKKKHDWLRGKAETAQKKYLDAEKVVNSLKEKGAGDTPDAPFKDTYHEYVLKRLLRMAAEEGYDSIGWTPARIQSERWSFDYAEAYRIEYDQDIPNFLKKYGRQWGATVGKSKVGEMFDSSPFTVWSMDITDSMKDSVLHEGQVLYSDRVTDKETLDFLENQEHVTVYRAMQLIDGKLYPPMNAYTYDKDGKKVLVTPSEIGAWEQSVERPDLIDPKTGKFKLDKGKVDGGKRGTIVPAAYNPYIHTSLSMLNDQFTSAYTRSNLVVVKGVVPKSELTSGYKAQFAKDSVGETEWHSGVVSTQLPESRKVILSRWFKPVDIMDNDVVAQNIKEMLGDTGIEIPYNVVSPKLRRSLEKIGVPIGEGRGIRNLPGKNEVKYSERDSDSVSNRSLLANALETAVQNDIERNKLAQYKEKIDLINAEEEKLHELNKKIREAFFTKGAREAGKIRKLQLEKKQVENRINTYDRQLLTLEASKPLKAVLEREKKLAYEKAEKEGVKALMAYREKAAKTTRELMTRYQESRAKATEGRHKTEYRHKIKKVVGDLNQLLLRPTKDKHIQEGLKIAVAEALSAINMDTVGAEERIAKLNGLIAKANDPNIIAELTATRDRIELQGENLKDKLSALQTAYEKIKNSTDPELKNAYQEPVMNAIKNVADMVGNTSIRDMSLTQLEAVYEMYKMILHTVRTANKAFKAKKGETITQLSEAVNDEIRKVGKEKFTRSPIVAGLRKTGWTLLKPLTAFRTIGSDTFTGLYNELRNGEDVFYTDINEAKSFIQEKYKKYNFKSWGQKKTKTFTAKSGKTFTLNLEQMMSIYAYSRRTQAHDHIIEGGIVLEDAVIETKNKLGLPVKYKVDTKSAFNISEETLTEICDSLTAEQKGFVDEMQAYLSDVMGAKGNEVSMELLGVELFKEKFYFPLKSSKYYMGFKPEEAGEIKLKNPAFSKETVQHANNPVVLKNFTDVWATHINDMSMYHAFVLPLEDFTRVYNYKTRTDALLETMSTEATIANAFGEGATQYIRNFLRSLNGGVRIDGVGIADKAISLTKKGAVLASASVTIQQPSAIMRAMALVNPIHFVATTHKSANLFKHKTDWAELKQYAPIAGIKEMGGYDIGMGQGTTDWIKDQSTIQEKVDDALGKAPAFMDEITWVSIWNAVKRETASKNKGMDVKSEAFLKKAGERFTEVISMTQVYDSVFSRSDIMRNANPLAKMLTAFMAEPSTTLNMLVDSIIQGKRTGKVGGFVKSTATTTGAIVAAIVFNSALKSIITAMRDDDEDESYVEKYLGAFVGNAMDDLNPLGYIPFVKDVVSIFKGYDVERMDMALFSDLKQAIDAFDSDSKSEYEKWSGLVGAVSAFFGVPIKNVERDIRGAYNTIKSFIDGEQTTEAGIKDSIMGALTGKEVSNSQQLYEAIISGDQTQIDRVKGRFKDQDAIDSAIKTALRENDSRIREAAQARVDGDIDGYARIAREIIAEGNFKQDYVVGAINAEINAIKREQEQGTTENSSEDKEDEVTSIYKSSDINVAFDNGDTATAKEIIQDLIDTKLANGMDEKSAKSSLRSSMTSYWKPLYKEAYSNNDTAEMYRIRSILLNSGLYGTANDVVKTAQNWLKD